MLAPIFPRPTIPNSIHSSCSFDASSTSSSQRGNVLCKPCSALKDAEVGPSPRSPTRPPEISRLPLPIGRGRGRGRRRAQGRAALASREKSVGQHSKATQFPRKAVECGWYVPLYVKADDLPSGTKESLSVAERLRLLEHSKAH